MKIRNISKGDFVTTKNGHKGTVRTIKSSKTGTLVVIVEVGNNCVLFPIEYINGYEA